VCGIALPAGLHDGSRLDPPIFTPATKEDAGHDENISFERMWDLVGRETAEALRQRSIAIYEEARAHAWTRGLVLADTKFEFGRVDGALTLIDEVLSPDSSRYWDRASTRRAACCPSISSTCATGSIPRVGITSLRPRRFRTRSCARPRSGITT